MVVCDDLLDVCVCAWRRYLGFAWGGRCGSSTEHCECDACADYRPVPGASTHGLIEPDEALEMEYDPKIHMVRTRIEPRKQSIHAVVNWLLSV